MNVEVQVSSSCGHRDATLEAVKAAMSEAGIAGEPRVVNVGDYEQAKALRCFGSPTVRVDGVDVEYGDREPVFLLAGASGNGKTKIANRLALRLGRRLFSANLEALVSSYIGETSKNLGAMFRHVEDAGGVLLLDEGDAILTARGKGAGGDGVIAHRQVVSFLLRRLETIKVVLLITTNMEESIDPAFTRRIHGRIRFSNPHDYAANWRQALELVGFDDFAALDLGAVGFLSGRANLSAADVKSVALLARLDAGDEFPAEVLEQALRTFLAERHILDRVRIAKKG